MQPPECVDESFLNQVGREAVEEHDLRASDVPEGVDMELLLASRALDGDWLTRPNLAVSLNDLVSLQYAAHEQQDHDKDPHACAASAAEAVASDVKQGGPGASAVAQGFSVLHDVAASDHRK